MVPPIPTRTNSDLIPAVGLKRMLMRRVQRRMGLCHLEQLTEYLD